MEGHAKNCVEMCGELANTMAEQVYTVSTLCFDVRHFKKEELDSVG